MKASSHRHTNSYKKPLIWAEAEKYRQRKQTNKPTKKGHRGRCRDEEKNKDSSEQLKGNSHIKEKKMGKERQNLPQAILPVHSHIHFIHPAMRNSTCWNQQTDSCRRKDRGSRMNEFHHWIYQFHHAQLNY